LLRLVLTAIGFLTSISGVVPAEAASQIPHSRALSRGDHRLRIDDVNLGYHVRGSGPLLVVMSPDWGIGSSYLQAGLAPLEAQHTVVYVDARGSGASGRPRDPAHMGTVVSADDLERLRRHWQLPSLDLLGHSAGGTILLSYAKRYGVHVSKLILVDTGLPGFSVAGRRSAFKNMWRNDPSHSLAVSHLADPDPHSDGAFSRSLRDTIGWYLYDPKKYASAFVSGIPPKLPVWTLLASSAADRKTSAQAMTRLETIKVPTLIIVGREDAECPVEVAEEVHRRVSNSRLLVYDRDGHFPWIEARHQFLNDVETFLGS